MLKLPLVLQAGLYIVVSDQEKLNVTGDPAPLYSFARKNVCVPEAPKLTRVIPPVPAGSMAAVSAGAAVVDPLQPSSPRNNISTPGGVLPLAEAAEAHRLLEGRHSTGKIVLTIP